MGGFEYWIKEDEIDEVPITAIDFIIAHPEKFDLTLDGMKRLFKDHHELFGLSGYAGDEILKKVIHLGWMKAVHLFHPADYWAILCDDFKLRKTSFLRFIHYSLDHKTMTPFDELRIFSYNTGKVKTYRWQESGVSRFLEEYEPTKIKI